MDLSHLNPSQRDAVLATEGPVLVLAGAGSGKTRVITHRAAYLLELGIPPEEIVAVSFTNKAAGEMRERLSAMVGSKIASDLVLATFHSLGARMLRVEPEGFGLDGPQFSILDQGDVFGIVRGLLREYGHIDERRFDIAAIVQRISLWKSALVTPDQACGLAEDDEYDLAAAGIYEPYEERLQSLAALDFDDLIVRVVRGLAEDTELCARWQARFSYLMIDEYQDTNRVQFEMVRYLAGPRRNVCVVGDDDQAIYGWRGADVTNILEFERNFPGAKIVKLETNYRSRPPILECANATIAHNRSRHSKTLRPAKRGGDPVTVVIASDPAAEARWVGKTIRTLIKEERVPPAGVAVLYRAAAQSRPVEQELQQHGISYRVVGGQSFFDKKEVKDALAYLRVLVTPRDDLAVRRALETPPRGIGAKTLGRVQQWARQHELHLMDAIHRAAEIPGIPSRTGKALAEFSSLIHGASRHGRASASMAEALGGLLSRVDLQQHVRREAASDEAAEARWSGVKWLLDGIRRWEGRAHAAGKVPRWHEFLGSMSLDPNDSSTEDDHHHGQVTLATLHSAKGLEWDHVFLIGCEEGRLPHHRVDNARASDAIRGDVEEERRLFYVGVTRARERLWLTRGAQRVERGREVLRTPSRFLQELPDTVRTHEVAQAEELTGEAIGAMADAFLARFQVGDGT